MRGSRAAHFASPISSLKASTVLDNPPTAWYTCCTTTFFCRHTGLHRPDRKEAKQQLPSPQSRVDLNSPFPTCHRHYHYSYHGG